MKKLKTNLKPVAYALLAVFVIGGAGMAFYPSATQAADDKKAETAKPALTVTTTKPSAARLPINLAANGNVAAWQEASVSSESNGLRLTEVRVNVGDVVKAGDVLAVFSADTVNADLAQAKAAVQEAEANAADAVANAARARTLQNTGALSAQQISQYTTAEQTANARIASAKAALASQQLRLKYTRVVAPDNGIISARTNNATVGAVSGPGTELFRMIRQGRLEWRAEVVAADLRNLKTGTGAVVKAANGSEVTGKVRMIAPTVDAQTRSALVYVDLPASAGAKDAPFKAGMFASGQFELGTSDAITVPQQSIVVRDGFSFVFRLNADQHVSQIKVQPGRRLGDRIEVLGGLTADTQVVVRGAGFLNDGDLVHNVAETAPAEKQANKLAAK
ncbi:efflux RND transporter periplasmic adaptor subunit [Rugamonas sp. A1-17]|nr:efflux RND transporter periplasmic adaptor subunit [Rugamonas sp. A1-17]